MLTPSSIRIVLEQLGHDVAYACRGLSRAPVFTAVVAFTLSLGIGANAAILGVIDTLYFRKLPVPHPERIVAVYSGDTRDRPSQRRRGQFSAVADYLALRSRVRGVTGLASYHMASVVADQPLAGTSTWTAFVSGNYFDVLQVQAQIGRVIRADEEEPAGAHPVVVLSDFVWRSKFGADVSVLGREISIGNGRFTIIGVAPRGFTGVHPEGRTNLWIPYTMEREAAAITSPFLSGGRTTQIIGRLAPGATLDELRASVAIAAQDLRATYPARDSLLALRADIRDRMTNVDLSPDALVASITIWAMIALLHFVACSNVASLMLGRAAARRREIGVRLCLGASRMRILIESLAEAAMLAAVGAGGGLIVGRWLSGLLASMQFLSTSDPGLDLRVLAIVGAITLGTVLQFAILPALEATRNDPLTVLRGIAATTRKGARDRFGMIIVGQVAVSLLLLANAAVFVQLFERQSSADPGFDAPHLAVATIPGRASRPTASDWSAAYEEALTRVSAVPGVRAAAAARGAPLFSQWYEELTVPGRVPVASDNHTPTALQAIGPDYFSTIGAPMVRGREFTPQDRVAPGGTRDSFDVVIVNEALALRFWPGENPLGKRLAMRSGARPVVVGVVRNMHDVSTVGFAPRAYFPLLEARLAGFELVIRTDGDPPLPRIAAALGGSSVLGQPSLRTMESIRDDVLSLSRTAGSGLAICAGLALLLTALGLYGVVTMWAARRRGEIGIRLALGAPSVAVHRLLLKGIAELVGIGSAIGLVCAFGVVQIERGSLGPFLSLGPIPIVASIVVFAVIAGLSVLVPSMRAARLPPADVLRSS